MLLDARCNLRLVTNAMHEDDTLCLALTCRALRDVLRARFPRPAESHPQEEYDETSSCRLRTRDAVMVVVVSRLIWVRSATFRPVPRQEGTRCLIPPWVASGYHCIPPTGDAASVGDPQPHCTVGEP